MERECAPLGIVPLVAALDGHAINNMARLINITHMEGGRLRDPEVRLDAKKGRTHDLRNTG
jgi:hypothetical protein